MENATGRMIFIVDARESIGKPGFNTVLVLLPLLLPCTTDERRLRSSSHRVLCSLSMGIIIVGAFATPQPFHVEQQLET